MVLQWEDRYQALVKDTSYFSFSSEMSTQQVVVLLGAYMSNYYYRHMDQSFNILLEQVHFVAVL